MKVKKMGFILCIVFLMAITFFRDDVNAQDFSEIASGTCGENLRWLLDKSGCLTIDGIGDMYDYQWEYDDRIHSSAPWDQYYKQIYEVKINEGVTSIGANAFLGHAFTSVISIPDSVEKIPNNALQTLSNFVILCSETSCAVNEDFEYSSNCITEEYITGKAGNKITYYLDYNTRILTFEGSGEFYSDFSGIDIPGFLSVCEVDFNNSEFKILPSFYGYESLKEIEIPEGVEKIGNGGFGQCYRLENITLPHTLTCIGHTAFERCYSLKKIVLVEGITSIGFDAFQYCELESVVIPSTLNDFEDAFSHCGLKNVNISDGLIKIDSYAFSDCDFDSLDIPDSVKEIGAGAFSRCEYLKDVSLPLNLKYIDNRVFYGCSSLNNLIIPYGVEEIAKEAFSKCILLDNVLIPNTVKKIESDAFDYVESMIIIGAVDSYVEKYAITYGFDFAEHDHISFFEDEIIKHSTCQEKGIATQVCDDCGYIKQYNIEIDSTNHVGEIEIRHQKEATCAEKGYTGDIYCKDCGEKIAEGREIPQIDTHTWNTGAVTEEATCASMGEKTYICTICGETITEEIPQTNIHTWDSGKITKKATCAGNGLKTYTCKVCKISKTEEIIKTNIHTWNSGVVTKKATCLEKGVMTYKCIICGDVKTEAINITQHQWNKAYTIDKKATNTTVGLKSIHCSICGAVKKGSEQIIPKLAGNVSINSNNNIKNQTIKSTTNKKISEKKVKKKAQSFKLSAKSTSGIKVQYKLIKKNRNIKFASSSGKVTVKKGTKKGTYKIKVKMTVSENNYYKSYSTIKTITIKVK